MDLVPFTETIRNGKLYSGYSTIVYLIILQDLIYVQVHHEKPLNSIKLIKKQKTRVLMAGINLRLYILNGLLSCSKAFMFDIQCVLSAFIS